jgi:hypothetical protein
MKCIVPFCILLISVLLTVYSKAEAQAFRQVGDEFLEIVVMESDAIVLADVSRVQGVRVSSILMNTGALQQNIVRGSVVENIELPSHEAPLFSSPYDDGDLLEPKQQTRTQPPVRMLLFSQQNKLLTEKRYLVKFTDYPDSLLSPYF